MCEIGLERIEQDYAKVGCELKGKFNKGCQWWGVVSGSNYPGCTLMLCFHRAIAMAASLNKGYHCCLWGCFHQAKAIATSLLLNVDWYGSDAKCNSIQASLCGNRNSDSNSHVAFTIIFRWDICIVDDSIHTEH